MTNGFLITYKPKDDNAKTLLDHTLYGRLLHRNYRGRKYVVYKKGILDAVNFFRKNGGNVFVETIEENDIDTLKIFGEISVKKYEINDDIKTQNGKEYWENVAKEKDFFLKK